MVLSCLVEPLVSPLVGRGAGVRGRRTGISRSRLAATALACSALMAIACPAQAGESAEQEAETSSVRNAHVKPAMPSYQVIQQQYAVRLDEETLTFQLAEAPAFEQDALGLHRLRHKRFALDSGPGLGHARTQHRLTRSMSHAFLLFGSGQLRAGAPSLN